MTKCTKQILLLLAVDNVSIFCSRVKHTEWGSHEVNSIKDDPTDTAMSRGLRLTDARTRTPQHNLCSDYSCCSTVAETTDCTTSVMRRQTCNRGGVQQVRSSCYCRIIKLVVNKMCRRTLGYAVCPRRHCPHPQHSSVLCCVHNSFT